MNPAEQLSHEISRSISTARRRYANTADEAEKKVIKKSITTLDKRLALLDQASLLETASILTEVSSDLERIVAAAKTGPFDGHLAALEEHLQILYTLSGAMHAWESLPSAPEKEDVLSTSSRRGPRRRRKGAAVPGYDLPLPVKEYDQLRSEYGAYYEACTVRPEWEANVAYYVKRLKQNRGIYEQVGQDLNRVPWSFVGVIHAMECGFNFAAHMHNGDPLQARTVHVPSGRPPIGSPPFTWRQSAIDALTLKGFHDVANWSVPHMLYFLEKYNGFGYRMRRTPTPYLWSFSNLYEKGKFVQDGKFDPEAISKQCGAALMLKAVIGER